jgi:hypothetical protein
MAGPGGGSATARGGGAGKFSHFSEKIGWPSAVRPIGVQSSTGADVFFGFVCAHTGDVIRRIAIANTSFFMLLSQNIEARSR